MKIDEILNGVKVEWKQLGEICEIGTGKSNTNQQVENGDYPFYVRSKDIKKINHFDFNEEAVLIPGEGGVGEIFHYVKGKYALHQRVYRIFIKNDILKTKFLYYYMIAYFKDFILKNAVGSTVISIRKPMIENFQVPIPPLEIQEKIAKTLDKFTNYATELQTELQLRTKQYEYYRNLLLSKEFLENMCVKFDDKPCGGGRLETKMLGEICEILDYKRKPITKSKRIAGKYPYYGANGVQDYVDDYIFDGTFILMGEDGSVMTKNFTPVLHWVKNSKIWVNNHAHIFKEIKNKCNLRYVYFYLSIVNISDLVKGVPPKLNQGNLRNIKILIPPLQIQEKIVQILDKFSDIASNLEKGLPKEIDLRQKEYEFYRDRLLNFKKD